MKFSATQEQISQIAANAVNASSPMGLGHLGFQSKTYLPSEFHVSDQGIYLDYVDGRMVKLIVYPSGNGQWEINDNISSDYQSWSIYYRTVEQLVRSVVVDE